MGPASYSSSRLIDMKNPAQHADLVRWMIFLLGPVERVTPAWQPRSDMRISRRFGSEVVEETVHWEPNGKHSLNSAWNGVRDVRHEPISKRTTVWAGAITGPSDVEEIPVLCKASWMSTGRQQFAHELEILRLLQDPLSQHVFPEIEDKGVFRRTDLMREIPQWQEVASNLPKPYGLVDLSEEPDYIVRPDIGAAKPLERNQDESEPRITVALSALLLESQLANPLAVIQDLSMKQFLRIYIDVAKASWYLACEGIHHRDVTHDNIMARLIEEPGQPPRYAGVLIDFGSAIYSGERRDVDPVHSTDAYIKAGVDDGFAGSTFMISIAAHKHRCYDRTRDLRTIEECTNADGTIVVPEGSADKRWREKVVSHVRKRLVQDRLHRFIDDLESLLYCMCSQVGLRRFGQGDNPATPILGSLEKKQSEWQDSLLHLTNQVDRHNHHGQFRIMIHDMADRIQLVQQDLDLDSHQRAGQAITQQEHECFRDCVKRMEQAHDATDPSEMIETND